MCARVQQVWLCMKLKTWSFCIQRAPRPKKSILVIMQSSVSWNKQYGYDSWGNSVSTTWNNLTARWLLSKYCLKLMLSNRLKHVYRPTQQRNAHAGNHSPITARPSFCSICLSHFFSSTPSSSFFPSVLPTSLFVRENCRNTWSQWAASTSSHTSDTGKHGRLQRRGENRATPDCWRVNQNEKTGKGINDELMFLHVLTHL